MTSSPIHPPGTITLPEPVQKLRAERFEQLRASIETQDCAECLGHDQSRPGGADPHGRFAVHAAGGVRSALTRCSSLVRAASIAERQIMEGYNVLAAYDLDHLSGEEPGINIDDIVTVDGHGAGNTRYVVAEVMATTSNGYDADCYDLEPEDNQGFALHQVMEDHVTLVERAEPDNRLPARYDVALQKVVVVFNTVPTVVIS